VLNLSQHPERRIEIEWETESSERFFVRIIVEGSDRRGLLSDIATAISSTGTNITSAEIKAKEGGMTGSFVVEVQDLTHLKKVMKYIRRVNGVISAERREHIAGAEYRE
jgi:GTP diphosphokinase / guanosine-3',5'-bis(diphosphate) 3'-diphosphatase